MIGAQVSARALGQAVEDYASVLLRSASGVLGTIEVGNTFPRIGTDGESKIAWRDAILTLKDDTLRLTTATGEETAPGAPAEPIALTALRDALDHWRRGQPPPISVHDCLRAVHLIDQAYALAEGALKTIAACRRQNHLPRHAAKFSAAVGARVTSWRVRAAARGRAALPAAAARQSGATRNRVQLTDLLAHLVHAPRPALSFGAMSVVLARICAALPVAA